MAYQALYRKWRPQTFEQVLGQTATVKTLRRQIQAGRVAHAYLFCGCRGTGKTTMAKLMSRAINCLDPQDGEPCGQCESCRAIMNESTMDVLELDAASNNSVENIRDLLEQVRYPAQIGKYKVYIIDEVHMLSTAAFNALLKTLEEPPAHVVFILATTEPQKLPATILSRVQRYDFGRIPSGLMVSRMREALADMGLEAEDEALQLVARSAEGAMRDAFSILDMCVAGAENGRITAAQTREMLGVSDKDFLFDFFSLLAERDETGVMHKVDDLMRSGREPQVFMRELSGHCRALLTVQAVGSDAASVLDVTTEMETQYRKQAEHFSQAKLLRLLDLFTKAEGEMRFASTPRIGLESAVLHACEQSKGEDISALLEKIGDLEKRLRQMEEQFANGQFAITAPPAGSTTPKSKTSESPRTRPSASVPTEAADIWKKTLEELSRSDPPLFGVLKPERFIGARGDVYQVQIPLAKKDFSYARLNHQTRRDRISAVLSQVAGKPLRFEAVLENDTRDQRMDAIADSSVMELSDAFGRENVQIDEGKKP